METKVCIKCKVEKENVLFNKDKNRKDGFFPICKNCCKEYKKIHYQSNKENIIEYQKFYYSENKEKVNFYKKGHYQNNKEKISEKGKIYYNQNKEIVNFRNNIYYQNNKEKMCENSKYYYIQNKDIIRKKNYVYVEKRKLNDPVFKLSFAIRVSIRNSIKKRGYTKKSKTYEILGCSFQDFKLHLESQFQPWMNWDNYGNPKDGIMELNKTWDIDHIVPVSSAKTEEELLKLNHYSNLQPLCSYINRNVKRNKL
jgi:hypothetical protein